MCALSMLVPVKFSIHAYYTCQEVVLPSLSKYMDTFDGNDINFVINFAGIGDEMSTDYRYPMFCGIEDFLHTKQASFWACVLQK